MHIHIHIHYHLNTQNINTAKNQERNVNAIGICCVVKLAILFFNRFKFYSNNIFFSKWFLIFLLLILLFIFRLLNAKTYYVRFVCMYKVKRVQLKKKKKYYSCILILLYTIRVNNADGGLISGNHCKLLMQRCLTDNYYVVNLC